MHVPATCGRNPFNLTCVVTVHVATAALLFAPATYGRLLQGTVLPINRAA